MQAFGFIAGTSEFLPFPPNSKLDFPQAPHLWPIP